MKDRKYFCYELYKNLAIWSNNGRLGYNPCSFFTGYIKESDTFDLDSVWNGPERAELLRCVETDTPIPGCQTCYKQEESGLVSRRMAGTELYELFHNDTDINLDSPQGIDYSVGNLCNLKCVTCGPEHSTAWVPDYKKIYPLESVDRFKYDKFEQITVDNPALLKNIKTLHFHGGGEPLLSNNHINLLRAVKQVKGLTDVRVFYNTNATQLATQELLDLWSECRLVELYFSIDATGQQFDYMRSGATWTQVTNNLQWYFENMPHNHMFNINCTWSYLNLYYLLDLIKWQQADFSTNRYGDPVNLIFQRANEIFNIKHLSSDLKQMLLERFAEYPELQSIVNSINTSTADHVYFWENINKIDTVRQTNYRELFPEWAHFLELKQNNFNK